VTSRVDFSAIDFFFRESLGKGEIISGGLAFLRASARFNQAVFQFVVARDFGFEAVKKAKT